MYCDAERCVGEGLEAQIAALGNGHTKRGVEPCCSGSWARHNRNVQPKVWLIAALRAPFPPPEGCRVDLDVLYRIATVDNAAHAALGTRFVAAGARSAELELDWRSELTDHDGGLANGVLAALLDHACSLATVLAANGAVAYAGTMSLRVEYWRRPAAGAGVRARGECEFLGASSAHLRGEVCQAGTVIALARSIVAVTPL